MQRFDNFCSIWLWSVIQVLCAQLWYSRKDFTGWEFLRWLRSGKLNLWQLSAKWEFLRMVDKGNLTSGNFWQNMGRCKIVKKNLIVARNEEEQVYLFSLRDWMQSFSACWEKMYRISLLPCCRKHVCKMVSMGSFNAKKHSRQIQVWEGWAQCSWIAKFSYESNRCKPHEFSNWI